MRAQLLIIAKEPVPGRVKTRLCPPCSTQQAAVLAAAALADTMGTARAVEARRRVLVFEGRPPKGTRDFDVIPQRGTGLAERLGCAFEDAGAPALLIGMDSPQIRDRLLETSLASLDSGAFDAVFGPTVDGGYWALGLVRADRRVFADVPMSSPETGAAQMRRLHELGMCVGILPVLQDVDHYSDALAVASVIPASRFARAVARVERELAAA
ncbi:MAG: TIGR04282 family arsenosugar biosynthesis glycosyltransferase [Actinomycetota bacterium]